MKRVRLHSCDTSSGQMEESLERVARFICQVCARYIEGYNSRNNDVIHRIPVLVQVSDCPIPHSFYIKYDVPLRHALIFKDNNCKYLRRKGLYIQKSVSSQLTHDKHKIIDCHDVSNHSIVWRK